jgi:hypothetical protein
MQLLRKHGFSAFLRKYLVGRSGKKEMVDGTRIEDASRVSLKSTNHLRVGVGLGLAFNAHRLEQLPSLAGA